MSGSRRGRPSVLWWPCGPVAVLVAQAEGSARHEEAGQAGRQGMLLGLVVGLVGTVMIWNLHRLLPYLGQDPRVVALTEPYLRGLAW